MRTKRSFVLAATAAALGLTSVVQGAADHWILTVVQPLAVSRLDPIISPGAVSSHVHAVFGASNFNWELNDYATTQEAKCTTAIIGDDKSNYWSPLLMYQYPNGTFAPVLGGARIYYFTKSDDVKPFPEGLRMITGTALARNISAYQSTGVEISCDHGQQTKFLPNGTSHPGGCSVISAAVYFPSCGTGETDSDDHFSHMAWPQSYSGSTPYDDPNGANCPSTHPIKYPTIFAEFNYYLDDNQPWRNDECTLLFANGDCVGSSFHADFSNGWKTETLNDAISQCGLNNGVGDQLQNCAPLAKTMNESATWDCNLEGKIPDEEVGYFRPLDSLPGCNPLWKAGVDTKPTCSDTVASPELVGPNVYFNNLEYRTRIPLALSGLDAANASDVWPSLGNDGASRLIAWGSSGSDTADVVVGTVDEIESGLAAGASALVSLVSGSATETADATYETAAADDNSTSTSSTVSTSASGTATSISSATAVVTATPTVVEAAAVPTTKTCSRRKKRGLTSIDGLSQHLNRRSRRHHLGY